MKFFFITNSVELAKFAQAHGADRIFVDLEINGKMQRQGHLSTVISRHELADVERLRPHVKPGALLVRINPLDHASELEIDQVIDAGADLIMLPMFSTPAEVAEFVRLVRARARTMLLVETVGAMETLADCIAVKGVDEVHIGLNDLHLELGRDFMFELLAEGLVDAMAEVLNAAAMPFGIGGVARVGEGLLPAELILAEHARLGSTAAILSRTFHREASSVTEIEANMDFSAEVDKLRVSYAAHCASSEQTLLSYHFEARKKIGQIAASMANRKAKLKEATDNVYA